MNGSMLVGMAAVIIAIVGLSIFTGMQKQKGGNKIGFGIAAGLIMGTLVGGTSTVGTAQLAYNFGMTAWWFTLGGGLGCLVLALIYVKPLRLQKSPTLVGMVRDEYGQNVGMAATILNSVGTFINILSQLIAASAVSLVIFPKWGNIAAIIISGVFMILYVIFGGTKGAGVVGILKLVLLYITMVICGALVLKFSGGVHGFVSVVNKISLVTTEGEAVARNLWSLFGRGFWTDFGSCMSLILGVLTTQTYAQAILNAKSDSDARLGALISAVLIPILGIFGILVGLYMRSVADPAVAAAENAVLAKTALTSFILEYSGIPDIIAGGMLGALFIASVGTGAGLSLGIATVINRDLIHKGAGGSASKKYDMINKMLIAGILFVAASLTCVLPADTIQDFAFLSMALRGCTVFAPLCFAFWAAGRVKSQYAFVSVVAGSLVALIYGVLKVLGIITFPLAAVFPGILVGIIVMAVGYASGKA